ncbi:penicillin acylase family protein [Falsiroseomonas bella]|uniref:Penicillin acylase family protein n=1 Tax=Falsiroseomonas bella TaxID=2184016 RepID=A0A317FEL5_9PROT|nr:penicillin acylase family protein [Falsiroseomonas bella]PWS36379.1 penicillin acylase family protein [Falsiroseomonas bella]
MNDLASDRPAGEEPVQGSRRRRRRRRPEGEPRRRSGKRRRESSFLAPLLRFGGRVVGFVAVLAILAAFFALALVYTSLPDASEEAAIPGLSAPVSITLDGNGIPRITAQTERDAAIALGWLHARDRMFQMDAMRRGGEGRLAEIAGASALRLDRFTRTLGLAERARGDLESLSPEARDLLEAYAQGVNARIAARGMMSAPEFLVLGEPEPWKPEHSLLWGRVMGLWLSGAWRRDIERARAARLVDEDRLPMLWPQDRSSGRLDLSAVLPPEALGRMLAQVPVFGEDAPLPDSASNAWAVTAARSASGAPLLASDPHLGFQAPILWYLARIELPGGRFRAGATAPGVPAVVIGRNERLAWGFTTTHSDTQDVFIERLVDQDSYETPEGPRPFLVREEFIEIRGRHDRERLVVRETRNGPVISDVEPQAGLPHDMVLSVAMANLAPGDTSADGLLALNRATTLAEARAAAARVTSPPQNLMVAEASGGIAQYLVGRTPIREGGDGTLPVPGWDGEGDWIGFVPFDEMPHLENPASGMLAAANSRPAPPDHPVFLGEHWFGDWRLRRIGELLAARPRHSASEFAAMQNDTLSLLARDVLPTLQAIRPNPASARAHALLRDWDGTMTADAPQPLLFHTWLRAFRRLALERGGATSAEGLAGPEFLAFLLARDGRGSAWCGADACASLLTRSLDDAVQSLEARHGSNPADWRWGAVHVARFEHPVLRYVPLLGSAIALAAPTGGDGETVSRGGFRGTGDNPFQHVHGAGLRAVFDLADPDGVLVMIATGQSGHPLSDHWGDLLQRWGEGDVLRLGRSPQREAGRIRLTP